MDVSAKDCKTILVVDDDRTVLGMVIRFLERLEYHALAASTPAKAIQLIQTPGTKIDLVVTDVIMPEMNGQLLMEKMKAIKPELKFLHMSGYTASINSRSNSLAEEPPFIQKPFTKTELAEKIREIFTDGR